VTYLNKKCNNKFPVSHKEGSENYAIQSETAMVHPTPKVLNCMIKICHFFE
jgi:hypothetical protein